MGGARTKVTISRSTPRSLTTSQAMALHSTIQQVDNTSHSLNSPRFQFTTAPLLIAPISRSPFPCGNAVVRVHTSPLGLGGGF